MTQNNGLFSFDRLIKISAIILGILFGIVSGLLFYFSLLPVFQTTIFFIFGVSILVLILYVLGIYASNRSSNQDRRNLLSNNTYSIFAILGSIITTLIAISIVLVPFNTLIAILVGIIVFFFILTLSIIPLIIDSLLSE